MGWPEWGRWAAGTGRWLRANTTTLASSSSIDGSASSSGSSRSTAEVVDVRLVPGVPSSAARANERERRTPLIADAGVFASVSAARHAGLRRRCSRRSPGCVRAAGNPGSAARSHPIEGLERLCRGLVEGTPPTTGYGRELKRCCGRSRVMLSSEHRKCDVKSPEQRVSALHTCSAGELSLYLELVGNFNPSYSCPI